MATACVALLFSCGKDDDTVKTDSNKIIGTWSFVNLSVSSNTTWEFDDRRDVYLTNYVSYDNSGTFTITADSLVIANYGYKYLAHTKVWNYIKNELKDSSAYDGDYTSNIMASAASYKWISSDSIRTANGQAVMGDSSFTVLPISYVFSWAGDTLLMTTREDTTHVFEETMNKARQQSVSVTKLIKKK